MKTDFNPFLPKVLPSLLQMIKTIFSLDNAHIKSGETEEAEVALRVLKALISSAQ